MGYQVLARKWRPSSFSEMVGQEHVVRALTTALESERLHHAYLFTGTRGVGKTTLARLIAKSLNCDTGVTSMPCGDCASCVEIAEGRSVDVLEVDAASRTKVEDTRELLDNVQYAPTRSRFKIYLIDEVHMLSNHSFNALLKTLEEPPEHVKFILATTDPQKLPATVLSRCLQFNLKNMVPEQIVGHLKHVLSEESVPFDNESLALLARGAEGSMRDALSLSDQAIAHGSGKLESDDVRQMLGTVSRTKVLDLLDALIADDARQALAVLDAIASHSPDYSGTLDELASVLHQIALAQAVPGSIDTTQPEFARLESLAAAVTPDVAHLWWQMSVAAKKELVLASDPRSGLDMAILRLLAFKPGVILAQSHEAPPAKKSEPPAPPVAAPTQVNTVVVETAPASPLPHTTPQGTAVQELLPAEAESLSKESAIQMPVVEEPTVMAQPANVNEQSLVGVVEVAASEVSTAPKVAEEDLPTNGSWPDFFEGLGLRGVIHTVASHFELVETYERTLRFKIASTNAALFNERHQTGLASAIELVLEAPVTVLVAVGDTSDNTPARQREIFERRRVDAATDALEKDDCLNALVTDFDATIVPSSIRPPLTEL
mgnify:FL=1|jgi:DNA polymerase-3 subunit gamma/tau